MISLLLKGLPHIRQAFLSGKEVFTNEHANTASRAFVIRFGILLLDRFLARTEYRAFEALDAGC